MSTFTKIRDAVEGFFTGPVWNFVKPFITALEADEQQVLITAAKNAVSAGFATEGGGEVKMAAALASFTAEVIAKGLPFIESQARALIELALQNAKAAVTTPAVA
ncbi:hypothetical protein [Zavarzinella formosa]|uniref:hypothetical protein n=1 Tax=Zavarzinella formosa TaxID=360055 RepID=UPI000307B4FB|nr:hypothetical protein [Zavarzinella formosa]